MEGHFKGFRHWIGEKKQLNRSDSFIISLLLLLIKRLLSSMGTIFGLNTGHFWNLYPFLKHVQLKEFLEIKVQNAPYESNLRNLQNSKIIWLYVLFSVQKCGMECCTILTSHRVWPPQHSYCRLLGQTFPKFEKALKRALLFSILQKCAQQVWRQVFDKFSSVN